MSLPPVDTLLYLTDSGALQQGTAAHREARLLQANAVILGRPSLFAPGQEAIRVEAVPKEILPNNIVRVETPIGDFAVRQTNVFNGEKTAKLIPGQKIILTISPSGTSARIEIIPQQPPTGTAELAARPTPVMISIAGSSTPAHNPAQALIPVRTGNPDQTVRAIAEFEASEIGSEKRTELWLQGNLEAKGSRGGTDAQRGLHVTRAFDDAKSLTAPNAATRIAASFAESAQTYNEMVGALVGISPAILNNGLRIAPRLNSTFGFALMLFLLTLRSGGLRAWLGRVVARDIEIHDADDIFDYLDRQVGPRLRDLGPYGYWEVVLVPVMMKSLTQMVWGVRREMVDPETGHRKPGQHCALQMVLPACGPVQMTAFLYGGHLNVTILTTTALPRFLTEMIQSNAPDCFRQFALRGNVVFTNKAELWLPLLDGDLVNSLA